MTAALGGARRRGGPEEIPYWAVVDQERETP